jgi:hypothetical protein
MSAGPQVPLLGLFAIGAILLMVLVTTRWLLAPLRNEAKRHHFPVQYTFVDLYGLMAVLGLTGGAMVFGLDEAHRTTALVGLWTAWTISWFYSVRLLSRAGVKSKTKRLVTAHFTVPLTIYTFLFFVLVLLTVSSMSTQSVTSVGGVQQTVVKSFIGVAGVLFEVSPESAEFFFNCLKIGLLVLLFAWLILPRRLCQWAVRPDPIQPYEATEVAARASADDGPSALDPHVKKMKL